MNNDFYLSCYNDSHQANILQVFHIGAAKLLKRISGFDISNLFGIAAKRDFFFCARGENLVNYAANYAKEQRSLPFLSIINFMDVHQYIKQEPAGYSADIEEWEAEGIDPNYLSKVVYVDQQIGRLYDLLNEAGQLENTIIIIASDHGEAFNEHGITGHGFSVYNEEIKVPLIIRYPEKIEAGGRYEKLSGNIEILPTLLGLCEIEYSEDDFEGVDLLQAEDEDRYIFSGFVAHSNDKSAILHGDFKLIYDTKSFEYLLYNVKLDPGEMEELNHDEVEEFPAMIDSLDQRMNLMKIHQDRISMIHQIEDIKIELDLLQLRSLGYFK